jgi:hypothetical protein
MKAASKSASPAVRARSLEEEEIDRILGSRLLFDVTEPQEFGGPSPPVIYRAERAGMIELIRTGGRTKLTRATMKRIALEGLGPVRFLYGKQGEKKSA